MKKLFVLIISCLLALAACTEKENSGDSPAEPYAPFEKKTFATFKEVFDFIPAGMYTYSSYLSNNKPYCFAKGTDGSYIAASDLTSSDGEPDWTVFMDGNYYEAAYRNEQWIRRETYNDPYYELNLTAGKVFLTTPFLSFLTSNNCTKTPMSVSNETVAGVPVKYYKYESSLSTITTREEYWIMETGLCLKYQITSMITPENPQGKVGISEVTAVDFKVGMWTEILPKLPKLERATAPVPPYSSLLIAQYTKYANEWLTAQYPRSVDMWVKKYTGSGTITFMTVWHYEKATKYDKFTEIEVWLSGAQHQDILNYINTVKASVTEMVETEFLDLTFEGVRLFTWEGGNDCMSTNHCEHELGTTAYGIRYEVGGGTTPGKYKISIYIHKVGHL